MSSPVSLQGPAVAVEGVLFNMDNGQSPDAFTTVTNISQISLPTIAMTVDVTNVGDAWTRRFPTLHDMGKIALKLFWQMTDITQTNSPSIGTGPSGLRWNLINNALRIFNVDYNDGFNSQDVFPAYTTSFAVTGQVGKVWEASIELSNSGAPTLC